MAQYGIFFTQLGRDKIASATEGNPLDITHIAVGDGGGGYPEIDDEITSLVNELGRYPISGTSTPAPTQRQFSAVVPPELGPAVIRERGLIDSEGDLIAIAQAEPIEMPAPGPNAVSVTVGILATFNNADYVRAIVDLQGFVRATRKVTAGIGLKGGGDLTTDVTIDADFALQADAEDEQNLAKVMSPRRTWQAIAKWYDSKFSSFIKTMLGRSSAAQVRNDLELKSAALRDVGTDDGNVMEVGAFGLGAVVYRSGIDFKDKDWWDSLPRGRSTYYAESHSANSPTASALHVEVNKLSNNYGRIVVRTDALTSSVMFGVWEMGLSMGVFGDWQRIIDSSHLASTTGSSTEVPMSQSAVTNALNTKVDKEAGKGLSTNDFTNSLKTKLEGLEGTHWRGVFPSKAALESGVSNPVAGDYADVDAGAGHDAERYIWDASDNKWVVQSSATSITAAQVKQMYESNPDTNAFTDAEKTKLAGIEAGANKTTVVQGTGNSTTSVMSQKAVTDALEEAGTANIIEDDITYTVGNNGDFNTINEALEYLSKRYPAYKNGGVNVELLLMSGFNIEEVVIVKGIDLSWITIRSQDEFVEARRASIIDDVGVGKPSLFAATDGGKFPIIDFIVRVDSSSNPSGDPVGERTVFAVKGAGSSLNINSGKGLKENNGVKYLIIASEGGVVNASGIQGKNTLGYTDFTVINGGVIVANDTDASLSQPANAVTSNGIIYQ